MVRRINKAGYQAIYEQLPAMAPGAREAYRFDAERRKAKIAKNKQKSLQSKKNPKKIKTIKN